MPRFVNDAVDRAARYALGTDTVIGAPYLSIPVANRLTDYEEYCALTEEERRRFPSDRAAAARFAEECRHRRHEDRLILKPGTDRGTAA